MRRVIIFTISILLAGSLFAAGTGGGSSSSGSSSKGNGGGNRAATQSQQPTALELYNKGYAASDAGRYQEAADAFRAAIALKSDYAEAYNMLGFCTRKMGDVSGAFAYYDKALQLKPNFPEAREYYGEAYLQQGDLAKAVQQYIILEKAGTKNARELLEKIDDFVNKKS
jgi:tetratricopeptide (TPR) repeat protein